MANIHAPIRIKATVAYSQQCYRVTFNSNPDAKNVILNAGFTEDRRPVDYNDLLNIPTLNGTEIRGHLVSSDVGLGLASNQEVQAMLDSVFGG